MQLSQWLVIGLCVLIFAWFIGGAIVNRRRGEAVYAWLVEGLSSKPDHVRWNGILHSVAHLRWEKPPEPFHSLEILFVLEARENLLLWVFHLLQGRGDELYLRADLRSGPVQEVEVGLQNDRTFERQLTNLLKESYTPSPAVGRFSVARRGKQDPMSMERLKTFLDRYETVITRLSARRKSPQIVLRVNLTRLQTEAARVFFDSLGAYLK